MSKRFLLHLSYHLNVRIFVVFHFYFSVFLFLSFFLFGSAFFFFFSHFNAKPITCLYIFGRCVCVSVGLSRARHTIVYVSVYEYLSFRLPCKRTYTILMVCYHTRRVPYRTLTHLSIRLPMSTASVVLLNHDSFQRIEDRKKKLRFTPQIRSVYVTIRKLPNQVYGVKHFG